MESENFGLDQLLEDRDTSGWNLDEITAQEEGRGRGGQIPERRRPQVSLPRVEFL